MQLHDLQPTTKKKSRKRIGRGGARGTFSGRGVKGQKARAGGTPRPQLRDFLKKLPKRRGWKQKAGPRVRTVNITDLDAVVKSGEHITPELLEERGLIERVRRGKVLAAIKILGTGEMTKKITIAKKIALSKSARTKIEDAGGTIEGSDVSS